MKTQLLNHTGDQNILMVKCHSFTEDQKKFFKDIYIQVKVGDSRNLVVSIIKYVGRAAQQCALKPWSIHFIYRMQRFKIF